MTAYCLDLADTVNQVGATFDNERPTGGLNAWGNSFPAEELPFGGHLLVGGIRYALAPKSPSASAMPDHVEALGQRLTSGLPSHPVGALAILASGEMGPQQLSVDVHLAADGGPGAHGSPGAGGAGGDTADAPDGGVLALSVEIPGWLVRPDHPVLADQVRCSHQHYPGGYDLALLLPVLWSRVLPLPRAVVTRIELPPNPLMHVFAITLLSGVASPSGAAS